MAAVAAVAAWALRRRSNTRAYARAKGAWGEANGLWAVEWHGSEIRWGLPTCGGCCEARGKVLLLPCCAAAFAACSAFATAFLPLR